MQTQIKFLVGGANSLVGGFCAGDRARVSEALAKHLVEDLGVAKFDEPQVQAVPEPAAESAKNEPIKAEKPAAKSPKGKK